MQLAPVFIVNSIRLAHDHPLGNPEQSRFQNHIFEPFTQETGGARSVFGGKGLGKPIKKKIIEKKEGKADAGKDERIPECAG